MNDHDGVGSRLDDFVEVANRAKPRGQGERTIQPHGFAAPNQVSSGQIAGREIVVARDRDERPSEAPGHVLDETRLPAAGRPFQHDREAARVTGFEHRDFVGDGQVVRGIARGISQTGMLIRRRPAPLRRLSGAQARGVSHRDGTGCAEITGTGCRFDGATKKKSHRNSATPAVKSIPVASSIRKCTWIFDCVSR